EEAGEVAPAARARAPHSPRLRRGRPPDPGLARALDSEADADPLHAAPDRRLDARTHARSISPGHPAADGLGGGKVRASPRLRRILGGRSPPPLRRPAPSAPRRGQRAFGIDRAPCAPPRRLPAGLSRRLERGGLLREARFPVLREGKPDFRRHSRPLHEDGKGPLSAPDPRETTRDEAPGRWRALALLAAAELLGMALWFSASAVGPSIRAEWRLTDSGAAWLTLAVQLGFVAGTLVSAIGNLPDVLSTRRLFAVSAFLGAAVNAAFA